MAQESHKFHPGIAAVLSFVFNGLGQLYNGEIFKGLMIIVLSTISLLSLVVGSILLYFSIRGVATGSMKILGAMLFIGGLVAIIIVGLYSIFDAYNTASKK
jgi:TM2 domain-containing membrane protein YozV